MSTKNETLKTEVQTLDQKRAEFAYNVILTAIKVAKRKDSSGFQENKNGLDIEKFSSLVSKMPSYIITNGLGNTLAFLLSKKEPHHKSMIKILAKWLLKDSGIFEFNEDIQRELAIGNYFWIFEENYDNEKFASIMRHLVINCNIVKYSFFVDESLAVLVWLKRFCDGMIEDENKEKNS